MNFLDAIYEVPGLDFSELVQIPDQLQSPLTAYKLATQMSSTLHMLQMDTLV